VAAAPWMARTSAMPPQMWPATVNRPPAGLPSPVLFAPAASNRGPLPGPLKDRSRSSGRW
jgi:hypothetical protein